MDNAGSANNTKPVIPDSRFQLAAILDSSDDPIISKNLDGIITSWNGAASRICGYRADEMIGQSILRLLPAELHHEEEDILRRIRADERIDHYETVRVTKNGQNIFVSVTISPIKDDEGRVIGAFGDCRDISDRKRNDEIRSLLAAIVDSADDAIVSKDLNGIVRSWNAGACRIFGYSVEEMIGQSILRLVPDELRYEEDEILQKVRKGERVSHYETRRKKKNGESIPVSVTISPLRDSAGLVIGASKIARDISERKRVEGLLIQGEKLAATGRMAAAVAHEINNPLESLVNLIYLARPRERCRRKGLSVSPYRRRRIRARFHLARQTLGFYRDTGSPSEIHLHALLDIVLTVYKSRLVSANISVDTHFNDLQKVLVSRGEMIQIFSNLIANAIDAMRLKGGTLRISTKNTSGAAGNGVQTTIQDNGCGIQPEYLAQIFEPFFTTKGDSGSGIGLWVAKQLVEIRGGQISVTSSSERGNSGTSINVLIPFSVPPRGK